MTTASVAQTANRATNESLFVSIKCLLGKSLGTRRFQRAVSARDLLIRISRPQTGGGAYPGLVPINSSFAETARRKRCVPRARFHSFRASQLDMNALRKSAHEAARRTRRKKKNFAPLRAASWALFISIRELQAELDVARVIALRRHEAEGLIIRV